MKSQGRVIKFGDNIDTDLIIAARYLSTADPKDLAQHFMEDLDPEISKRVKEGDIVVAGRNFGCGSSREHAPIAIKGAGVSCVIAESFARIFYRNSFNIGLPIIESPEASRDIEDGDQIKVDYETGEITNITTGKKYSGEAYPPFIRRIIENGGLVGYVKAGGAEGHDI
ncbi:MAG TPA: 3-isopropylmalate dehydratase small subunit [Tissierellaceae bacterium]|nr:3-isopropylmalate dehydratase small subunit [Tissierellaceae bacterium]